MEIAGLALNVFGDVPEIHRHHERYDQGSNIDGRTTSVKSEHDLMSR